MRIASMLLIFLLILSALASAHGEEERETATGGYVISFLTTPEAPAMGEPLNIRAHIARADGDPVMQGEVSIEILRETFPMQMVEPGVYEHTYTFDAFGHQEFYVTIDNTTAGWGVDVTAPEKGNRQDILAIAMVLLIAAVFGAAAATKKLKWTSALLYGGISVVAIGLGYSVFAYNTSPAVQGCLLQVGDAYVLHCHQNVHISICDEEKGFPWEAGLLDRAHTHKGDHRIHWHPGNPVHAPTEFMTLRNMFSDLGYALSETGIEDPESGTMYAAGEDGCGTGTPGELRVYVTEENSKERTEVVNFLDHSLPDESRIDIEYT